jgi:hypothetical protein
MDSIDTDTRTDKSNVKVKRILAKRQNKGSFLYLVQMIGEPKQTWNKQTSTNFSQKQKSSVIILHVVIL